jgi:hypothetical protein
VRRRLSEVFAQSQAEIETLKKTENELRVGQNKLEELGKRLDQEQVWPFSFAPIFFLQFSFKFNVFALFLD